MGTEQEKENKCPPTSSTNIKQENSEVKCPLTTSINTEQQKKEDKSMDILSQVNEGEKKCPSMEASSTSNIQSVVASQENKVTRKSPINNLSYQSKKSEECDVIVPPKKNEVVSNYYGGVITNLTNESFVKGYCKFQQNGIWNPVTKPIHRDILIQEISSMRPWMKCTSQHWTVLSLHPADGQIFAVASKQGEILMCRVLANDSEMIAGLKLHGAICSMQISKSRQARLYVASKKGNVHIVDNENTVPTQLLKIDNRGHWYTSLCVDEENNVAVVGDTAGILTFVDIRSHKVLCKDMFHGGKVLHVDLNIRDRNMLATSSSNDHCVKLWDWRKKCGNENYLLKNLLHNNTVRSSYFSLKDGNMLVTTDQESELRVYSAPLWNLERTIVHPHRQLRLVEQIRAYWHPLEDIIVVGRHPDSNITTYDEKLRCIDFIDATSGKLLYELTHKRVSTISPINQFNCIGDVLASLSGEKLVLWSNKA